jgi:hypothetical protein
MGQREEVGRLLEQVSIDVDRLVASNPGARFERVSVLGDLLELKSRWTRINGQPGPIDVMQGYLDDVTAMQGAGKRLSVDQNRIVSLVELTLGDELARLGKAEQANEFWVAARNRLQEAPASTRFEELALLAWAEYRLGQRSEAMVLAERLRVSRFRHPAYAEILKPLVASVQLTPAN